MRQVELLNLKKICIDMRRDILSMCYRCGAQKAHLGGCMSSVEILAVLYLKIMNLKNVKCEDWEKRDRFLMSKAHAAIAQYAALFQAGILTKEEINGPMRGPDTITYRHLKRNEDKAIEYSAGSLGMGLGYGVGLCHAIKRKGLPSQVYVMLGDGECNEGSIWESAAYASHAGFDNLTVLIDKNGLQLDGRTSDVLDIDNMRERWQAFGFETKEIDGHSLTEIYDALKLKHQKPVAIIANTVKGKGISFAENRVEWHDNYLTDELYDIALKELEVNYDSI